MTRLLPSLPKYTTLQPTVKSDWSYNVTLQAWTWKDLLSINSVQTFLQVRTLSPAQQTFSKCELAYWCRGCLVSGRWQFGVRGRWKVVAFIQINQSIKRESLPSYHSLTHQDLTRWRESARRGKMNLRDAPPKVQVRGTLAIQSIDRMKAVWTALTFEGTASRTGQNKESSCSSSVFHCLTLI